MAEAKKKKVLVVDDEPSVRELVRRILGKDCIILEAKDGGEAVDMARSHKVDLILMDMMMPKVDGLTACYIIKSDQATKNTPVVMLTAVSFDLNKKLSQDVMGAAGYITKPFTNKDLRSVVDRFLGSTEPAPSSSSKKG